MGDRFDPGVQFICWDKLEEDIRRSVSVKGTSLFRVRSPVVREPRDILLRGRNEIVEPVCLRGNLLQHSYRFVTEGLHTTPQVCFTDYHFAGLFVVDDRRGVTVSTWQSEGICRYAGLAQADFLVICALLGLVQHATLEKYESMYAEDCLHREPEHCLFAVSRSREESALKFEQCFVCGECLAFYRCLGLEPEVGTLLVVLDQVRGQRSFA